LDWGLVVGLVRLLLLVRLGLITNFRGRLARTKGKDEEEEEEEEEEEDDDDEEEGTV